MKRLSVALCSILVSLAFGSVALAAGQKGPDQNPWIRPANQGTPGPSTHLPRVDTSAATNKSGKQDNTGSNTGQKVETKNGTVPKK